ncbi:HAD domain-containing protein [Streptomyces cyaneofuscatus]|uniref:HAD domain-containing protein n=1 Tax=Streptomyces cyaneofuscatus TaxID=66883 RepID=UPI00365A2BDB
MTSTGQRPLLCLDVDGPLIPFGGTPQQYPEGYPRYRSSSGPRSAEANPLLTRINPAHGPRLASLGYELVWASTWMADANECIAPWLGLPPLPVVSWPDEPPAGAERDGLHWKTRALVDRAGGRAFAWVDDEITETDRAWVERHHRGRALLHRVDPRHGLTDADFAALTAWRDRH